jgi:hypothetical protein
VTGHCSVGAVDDVTQWQVVGAAAYISEAWLIPVLEAMLRQLLDLELPGRHRTYDDFRRLIVLRPAQQQRRMVNCRRTRWGAYGLRNTAARRPALSGGSPRRVRFAAGLGVLYFGARLSRERTLPRRTCPPAGDCFPSFANCCRRI